MYDYEQLLKMVMAGRIANEKEEKKRNLTIKGKEIWMECNGRKIRALYYPSSRQRTPVYINVHGGGFVYGAPEYEDPFCTYINQELDITIFNIEYRLAPENPFPCGLQDVCDTISYINKNADVYGVIPQQMIIGGNSAGAALTTAACHLLKTKHNLSPLAQILIYPCLDMATSPKEKVNIDQSIPLERAEMYNNCYRKEEEASNPYCSPSFFSSEDLRIMPDTLLLTAEFDNLREEGEAYAYRLMRAGTEVTGKRVLGVKHGYFTKDMSKAIESYAYIASFMKNKIRL